MRVQAILAFNQNRPEEGFVYYAKCLHETSKNCNSLEFDDLRLVLSGAIDCMTRIESDVFLWDSEILRVLVGLVENGRFRDIRALMRGLPFLCKAWFGESIDASVKASAELVPLADDMDSLFNKDDLDVPQRISRLYNLSRRLRAKRQFGHALVCAAEAVELSKNTKEKTFAAKPMNHKNIMECEFLSKIYVDSLYEFGQVLLALGMFYRSGRVDFADNFLVHASVAYQTGLNELREFERGGEKTRNFLNRLTQTDALLKRSWRTALRALQCQFFSSKVSYLLAIQVQAMLVFFLMGIATSFMGGADTLLITPAAFAAWSMLVLALLIAVLFFWLGAQPLWKRNWRHECVTLLVASVSFFAGFQNGIDLSLMVFTLCARHQDLDKRPESLSEIGYNNKIPNGFTLTPETEQRITSSSAKRQTGSQRIEQLLKAVPKLDAKTAKPIVYDCLVSNIWNNELIECRRIFEQTHETSDETYPLALFLIAENSIRDSCETDTKPFIDETFYAFANWFETKEYSRLSKNQQHNLIYPVVKIASVFLRHKDYAQAKALFSTAIKLNDAQSSDSNQQLLQSKLLADLGQVNACLSDYDASNRAFEEALKIVGEKRTLQHSIFDNDYEEICGAQIQMFIKKGDYLNAVKTYESEYPIGSGWNSICGNNQLGKIEKSAH